MNAIAITTDKPNPIIERAEAMGFNTHAGFELMQRGAKLLASSTLVPKEFQGNLPNCVIAINMASRLGADPLLVMQNLYVVHGRPGWSSQFLIATFNQCGRFTAMRFEFFGEKGTPSYGCRAWATEKATGEKIVGTDITMDMAKKEGWSTKSGSKWMTMPQQMLTYRAASFLVRAYAPELSMGLQTADELVDIGSERPGMTVTASAREPALIEAIEQELKSEAGANPEEADAADPAPITAQAVHDKLAEAADRDALDEAADLINMLPESERAPLHELYEQRALEVVGG
jgi:hypothetical protein